MAGFLDAYVDLALPLRQGETAETITLAERERLARQLALATTALMLPRRLGQDVSAEELAADKMTSKRIAHVTQQLLTSWGGAPATFNGAVSREAAVVRWPEWWLEQRIWLEARKRYVATWCHKVGLNGDLRWCKSAVVRLDNELKWLAYALR